MGKSKSKLSSAESEELISVLRVRFEKNGKRHNGIEWNKIEAKLKANPDKLWSLYQMELTGGEPDVIIFESDKKGEYAFYDCVAESPKGRRSVCYDHEALEARKEHKPKDSAINMADDMGIEILSEEQYRELQQHGPFDTKTSSWVKTPSNIRDLDGALFMDYRYGTVFLYHNGAESYYAARGFRGVVRV